MAGTRGLLQLAGLYNLADLYLVRAPVSDAGMRTLGGIGSLESLYLVETPVTDAGLEPLAALKELIYLRLEGTAGVEFSHRGLAHLTGLPKLRKLTLYRTCSNLEGGLDVCVLPEKRPGRNAGSGPGVVWVRR